jgi:Tol biopolymer transport system component/DNA-binding winged helix-turn-helix (wHTH) protein
MGSKAAKIVFKELSKSFQKPFMPSPFNQFYEFDPFVLDASERVLMRGDDVVHLTPKEFETLLALVRGGGRVMSKEELLREIWPDTFVGEATLAQNVFTLRKALGEAESGKPYIETIPRRGYRFAAKVRERREEETPATNPNVEVDARAVVNAHGADESRLLIIQGGDGSVERNLAINSTSPRSLNEEMDSRSLNEETASIQPARQDATAPGGLGGAAPPAPAASSVPATSPATSLVPATSSATSPTHVLTAPPTTSAAAPEAGGHPVRAAILISVVVLVVVAALIYGVFRLSIRPETDTGRRPAPAFQSMKVTRLSVTGAVAEAVISPDGNYLAYVADEPGRQGVSVWVRQVAAASNTQQLVAPIEGTYYGGLVFSPDSQHVYYGVAHNGEQPPALFRVPVLGGPPVKILEAFGGQGGAVAFSPDGHQLAFVRGSFGQEMTLVVADTASGGERSVVTRKSPSIFGLPAWSPDGGRIACVYGSAEALDSSTPYLGVTTFGVRDGAESRVTTERWVGVSQLSWLPDGSGLVLSATEQELSPAQIWLLSFPTGEVRRVTNDLNTYLGASLTADGSALVTVQTDRVPNIWVAPNGDAARAWQVTTGSGKFDGYYGVSWMPDGRLVYASVASGSWDIWVMNADGTGQKQLTVSTRSNYGPSVSADGRHIVFVSNRAGGAFNIWVMEADGSNPKRLTSGRGENFPHVTPDGRWVVYASVGFGQPNAVWKVSIDGGEPVKLTDRPASWPFLSPDGKSFVCTYGEGPHSAPKLAVISLEGGEPTRLFDIAPSFRANTVWLPDNRGIAFLDSRTGTNNVWMQPLNGGKPIQLTDFKSDNIAAFDWSHDNRLAATRSVETTGVVLIKDFR